ncbi:hypothetical protein MSAN_00769400 [Mycena sanguinolenta]|uniref:Uncharacterized protein n=1 Tax=Mycena sanguinolenta TaxID=230812 RepID=A0A8H6Z2Z5_9AGAR|nr:hypothetical protein MSAN_00769400 [Mycena sanguinolenta]
MTGTVASTMTVTGHVESPQIQLANVGLDFPGILTIGFSFTVLTQVIGDVDVAMDMTVGLNFDVNNAQLAFPPTLNKPLSSAFSIGNTHTADFESCTRRHRLNLGVNALGGKAEAQIFLNLDTNAALQMNLDASASANKDITPPALVSAETTDPTDNGSDDTTDNSTDDTADDETTDTIDDGSDDSMDDTADFTYDTADSTDSTAPGSLTTSTSFGGYVGVSGGVDVNAGATGDFFGLFTASATLFSKSFQIFQKCSGPMSQAAPRIRQL